MAMNQTLLAPRQGYLVYRLRHLVEFGIQQSLSCLFPAFVFTMLALSHAFGWLLPRYDFMLIACLLAQIAMLLSKIESRDEVLVICVFHLLGLMMELFKVHFASWSYPEAATFKFFGVPLYSGFMYASVASYMCQAWRRFDLKLMNWPSHNPVRVVGAFIYLNFFSNHFIPDVRLLIGIAVIWVFRKSVVVFHVLGKPCKMPVVISFLLIGFFIWLGENAATMLGAWKYAYQHDGWHMVNCQKISSWAFLVIVSYIIVAELKLLKANVSPGNCMTGR
jgi:uncharacterized membrane protein YoaT (DUF817 family)